MLGRLDTKFWEGASQKRRRTMVNDWRDARSSIGLRMGKSVSVRLTV
jgi:hypothetical protein